MSHGRALRWPTRTLGVIPEDSQLRYHRHENLTGHAFTLVHLCYENLRRNNTFSGLLLLLHATLL
jgi:hypothetical protein